MPQQLLHYDVLERLGTGAGSTIYAVSDPKSGQVYALKHVLRKKPRDIRYVEQMQTEFDISRQFNHPNLRKTFELKIKKNLLMHVTEAFLLMELFDGRGLDVRPPKGLLQTVDIFIQTAAALKAMHALGYAHCDIKPNNILRNDAGDIKVIDFGQSCKIGTIKERIQGTPDYIAPEQVVRKPIGAQTDVFNLGATLYWALTGSNIPTLYTVNRKGSNSFLLETSIPSPRDTHPSIPVPLSNLVMESVSTKPQARPSDMGEVGHRLEIIKHILVSSAGKLEQTK